MRRIDELIAKHCPEGVEFKTLGQLFGNIPRGRRLTKSDLAADGSIPVFHGGLDPIGFHDRANTPGRTVMIINTGASSGTVGWSEVDFWCSDGCFALPHSEAVLSRYLYYYALSNSGFFFDRVRRAGIPTLAADAVLAMRIPIPPLEVQWEIVGVLDQFTQLEAELESELEARQAQYEHYRDRLLAFRETVGVRWVPMGEFASLVRGNGMPKTDFVDAGVPAIHYGQIYTHYGVSATETKSFVSSSTAEKLAKVDPGDIVITNTSENLADVGKAVAWLGSRQAVTGGHATVIKHNENPKFLVYYFQTAEFDVAKRKHATGTKVIDVSAKGLAKVEIPLPPRVEQDRIVSILDKFDSLLNDLSIGIPAELDARRRQYEYYRHKLLTFQEASV